MVLQDPQNTNNLEIRELLDKAAMEQANFKGRIDKKEDVVQTLEYIVTGMSRKFYFPNR